MYKPDVVISSSPPIFTSLAALIYSKIKKAKFIFDVRDIWPDIGVELKILTNKFFIYGLAKIEKYILNNADTATVTAEGDKVNLKKKVNRTDKIKVIYNGADTEIFKPINEEKKKIVREKYNIPLDKKVIIYFGSYNHGMNDIEILGDFLTHEKFNGENLHFLSIGSGDNLENLIQKIAGKISYSSILSLPMEEVAKLVAASDVSIIPRKNIKKDTGGNIPVKCFESWASEVPVLLSNIEDAEISDIFKKCDAGILVEPNNVQALVNGLDNLLNKNLKELGSKGRGFVIKNFDRKKQSKKILEIINSF